MKKLFFVISIICCLTPAMGQKRAFTIADLYKIKSVSDPQYSPDGRQVAFTMSESFLEQGKTNSEIYVMDAEGGNIRNLTNNPAADNHPRWSPDGKSILFISSRKNGSQAWLMPRVGGEPIQLTDLSIGVGDAEWSPNGAKLIFSADVYPECGAVDSCNNTIDESTSNGPLKAHIADNLLYRHWTFWKDGKRTHTFLFDIALRKLTDLTPGNYDAPAWEQGGTGFTFSADGNEVCYVSNHDDVEATSTNKDLWIVPATGGAPKNITAANPSYDSNPVYSPDGKYIAYKTQRTPAYESDLIQIALYDRASGTSTILTDKFNNWVNDFTWSPDSKSLYFTGQVKGHAPMYKIDIDSKKITQVIDVKSIDAFSLSPDGKWFIFPRRSVGEPVELWRCTSEGKELRQLTFFNKPLAEAVDIRPAEEMWIPSPTGTKIHTFIVKPHNFDSKKKYPLILNVHGGPQSQWQDAFRGDYQVYPGSGYIVAFANPHGSTGYGQEFTAEISKDFGGKVYEDVMAVADSLEKISWVDKNRMGAMGWSYGGYMMMWLEGHTSRFKAIVSMMGLYDLTAFHGATEELWFPEWDLGGKPWNSDHYIKFSPNQYVKNFVTPCLVITGEKDYRVPYTQSLEFFTDLQEMKVPSRLIVFPNDGHWPSNIKSMPLYYNAHLDWFNKYLGGEPAPYDMTKMIRNQAYQKP
jgi:dipeptidyl aminopeptidase/acylaminoacyl peptidase